MVGHRHQRLLQVISDGASGYKHTGRVSDIHFTALLPKLIFHSDPKTFQCSSVLPLGIVSVKTLCMTIPSPFSGWKTFGSNLNPTFFTKLSKTFKAYTTYNRWPVSEQDLGTYCTVFPTL